METRVDGASRDVPIHRGSAGAPPFTVEADLDLSRRISRYLARGGADVTIRQGSVPERLEGDGPDGAAYQVRGRTMLLTVPNGLRYLIEDGRSITYACDTRHGPRDIALFLLGSAWAALCYQRGLLLLHAGAVRTDRAVHAFTGPSGAGKSTLTAALAGGELEFFTDDVLIMDPTQIDPEPLCFAAHEDLKLWDDAIALTGATRGGPVRDAETYEKYYSEPRRRGGGVAGRLAALFVLDQGAGEPRIEAVSGSDALIELAAAVYRPPFAAAILGRRALYEALGRLAGKVRVLRFSRPFDDRRFAVGARFVERWIVEHG